MNIRLLVIGKTQESYLKAGMAEYESRIKRYVKFSVLEIPGLKNTVNLQKTEWKVRESEKLREQLNQVLETYNIPKAPAPLTRCSICNHPLSPIAKENVRNLVPEYVYQQHDHFFKCNQCGKVYWRGTHVKRMEYRRKM